MEKDNGKVTEGKEQVFAAVERERREALEGLGEAASGYCETERIFQKVREQFRGEAMPEKRLEFWEDMARGKLRDIEWYEGWVNRRVRRDEEMTEISGAKSRMIDIRIPEANTIEVAAGDYYEERSGRILQAVREKGTEDELKIVTAFPATVLRYAGYRTKDFAKVTRGMSREDAAAYDRARTAAHNDVVELLNAINGIAEKYEERRLTVRNFLSTRKQNGAGDPALQKMLRYDRDVVWAYCRRAFGADIQQMESVENKYGGFR